MKKICSLHIMTKWGSKSRHVINHDIRSLLKFIAVRKKAWVSYQGLVCWADREIVLSYEIQTSSKCAQQSKHEVYNNTILFLNEFIHIISSMEVGVKTICRPTQTRI